MTPMMAALATEARPTFHRRPARPASCRFAVSESADMVEVEEACCAVAAIVVAMTVSSASSADGGIESAEAR